MRLIDIDGQPTQRSRVQTGNFIAYLKNYDYLGRHIKNAEFFLQMQMVVAAVTDYRNADCNTN